MNDYYNAPDSPVDFTTARASVVRSQFAAIAAAFDLLPARDALLQGRINYAVAAGTANALTITLDVAPEEYVEGASFRVKIASNNTGAATLNVNALGAIQIVDSDGAALAADALVADRIVDLTYNEGVFQLPATGPQGPQGEQGIQGESGGLTLLNGTTDPGPGDGSDGDFFIKTVGGFPDTIFGPKAAGAWPAGISMIGADGANGADGTDGTDGNTILNGLVAPTVEGVDGDFYIDTVLWNIYGPKAAGVWPAGHSIMDLVDVAFTGTNTVNALEIGFRDLPISRTVSANFTLDADDRGKAVIYDNTGHTGTVPLNSTESISIGSIITICNNGTGPLNINRESASVTLKLSGTGVTDDYILAVGGVCWLWKISTNTWYIGGTGLST